MFAEALRGLSPTLGEIEAFGEGIWLPCGGACVIPHSGNSQVRLAPASLRLSNLKYLRLAGAKLAGHACGRRGHTFTSFAKVPHREPWRCETKIRRWKVEEVWNILLPV